MAMWNVEHSFGKGISTLHIVEVATGRTESGFTGKRDPADVIAAIAGIHGSVFRISAVEDLSDFGDDDGPE